MFIIPVLFAICSFEGIGNLVYSADLQIQFYYVIEYCIEH